MNVKLLTLSNARIASEATPSILGSSPMDRGPSPDKGDGDADEGSGVFKKNDKLRRILAFSDCREVPFVANRGPKASQGDQPRTALEEQGQTQDDVNYTGTLD